MPLRLYNSRSKQEEDFAPIEEGKVGMYTCGPTVYGRPHIGNYSSFLLADLLRRWLETGHGLKVTHVKNITDVGHLTGDDAADADGADKIEKQSRKENTDPLSIARKYTEQYLDDEQELNFREPEYRPKATEVIPEMITMIETLIAKGHAYETGDGVYFDVTTFPDYGKLSGNTLDNLSAGARIAVDENKKNAADFALWKKCVGVNANHILRWDSPWGEGFPGWHIECSCMSEKFLGSHFDIHTGGEDLIFPHHECEIAQSVCSGDGTPHVRYWLHKRFIDMGDTKMSKSLGNVLTLPDIIAMNYSPQDLRYYLLSVHYRTNLKFTEKGLDDAHNARRRIMHWMSLDGLPEFAQRLEDGQQIPVVEPQPIKEFMNQFTEAMDDDLNTPKALASVFECMNYVNSKSGLNGDAIEPISEFIDLIKSTFGCFEDENVEVPPEVEALAEQRVEARKNKDFEASDRLRDEILALGYEVKDTPEGQKIVKL